MAIATTPTSRNAAGQRRSLAADPAVAGHRRGTRTGGRTGGSRPGGRPRLWSVRTQLLAPILVATFGLGVLGTVQTGDAVASARDAARGKVVASTATATVRLTHELERELAETAALRQRGGKAGERLVTAQRSRTDLALSRYRVARAAAARTAPALQAQLNAADVELDKLGVARSRNGFEAQTDAMFHDITTSLLAVADALPAQLRDPNLASAARAVAALAAVEHYHALERDLLRGVYSRASIQGTELIDLARIDASRQQREAEFVRVADTGARDRYERLMTGPDVDNAAQRRNAVLTGQPVKGEADSWYVAQSGTIRKVNLVGLALVDQLDRHASELSTSATRRAWLTAVGTISLGLAALAAALFLAVRTSRRLRRLRVAALTVARHELPDTIAKVSAGASVEQTIGRDSEAADITRRIAASEDEVGEVADAFSSVHHTALRLASDQAELHLDVARMAEVFARRIRTLITRQLRLLDEFEREETDPEALSRFFALDHLAARLRRNGENLLVLAGGEPGRPASGAFPLAAVVAAAASEIEDFGRVETQAMDAAVAGPVVGDLVHLLAELLENAAQFSPPNAPVRVDARHTVDGMVVRVHDSGIGLTEARLAEVNARLAQQSARLSSAAAGTMGLYVVAHLAARHGIRVQLHTTASGTVAYVLLPPSVLAPVKDVRTPVSDPARAQPVLEGVGARPGRGATAQSAVWFRPELDGAAQAGANGVPAAVGGAPRAGGAVRGGDAVGLRLSDAVSATLAQGFSALPAVTPTPGAAPLPGVPPTPGVAPLPAVTPTPGGTVRPAGRTAAVVPAGHLRAEPAHHPGPYGPAPGQEGTVDSTPSPETPGGLPRRRPGAQYTGGAPAAPAAPAAAPSVDPEAVRHRLSALAEGVSAAMRHSKQPTPLAKDR
ncbi:nitrate- and nitrite sensing domain-containing protein [Planosporangium sp. 12N6]|uniref:sensor histidine kinase n=1 Tax=Planosporangium spinosum TaxID=3402278 RepID=UPI003CE87149